MMPTLADLYRLDGKLGRLPFLFGAWGMLVLHQAGERASLAALPWMAEILAPRGINAGLALNAIWLALGLGLVWTLIALFAKRLRTVGYSPWLSLAAIVPPAILALLNDAIFLLSRRFPIPSTLNWILIAAAAAVSLWLLAVCLLESEK